MARRRMPNAEVVPPPDFNANPPPEPPRETRPGAADETPFDAQVEHLPPRDAPPPPPELPANDGGPPAPEAEAIPSSPSPPSGGPPPPPPSDFGGMPPPPDDMGDEDAGAAAAQDRERKEKKPKEPKAPPKAPKAMPEGELQDVAEGYLGMAEMLIDQLSVGLLSGVVEPEELEMHRLEQQRDEPQRKTAAFAIKQGLRAHPELAGSTPMAVGTLVVYFGGSILKTGKLYLDNKDKSEKELDGLRERRRQYARQRVQELKAERQAQAQVLSVTRNTGSR